MAEKETKKEKKKIKLKQEIRIVAQEIQPILIKLRNYDLKQKARH